VNGYGSKDETWNPRLEATAHLESDRTKTSKTNSQGEFSNTAHLDQSSWHPEPATYSSTRPAER
jgi:hypothetical protein